MPYSIPLPDLTQDPHFDDWTMDIGGTTLLNWAIPMAGDLDSLNVSVAAGILLAEAARQRRAARRRRAG